MELFIRNQSQAIGQKSIVRRKAQIYSRHKLRRFTLRSRKRMVRFSLLTANLALLGVVMFFVTRNPAQSQSVRQNAVAPTIAAEIVAGPLDQVSSADIAVHVARVTGLPEAVSVVNHADSVSAIEATTPADTSVVAKPQVVSAALPSRKDIHVYTTVAGDTISSIATKFGNSSESIKWSNGISSNSIAIGRQLLLPPAGVNGIVYTVKSGDTAGSLARKYNADKDQITSFNDAEVSGLIVGEQILIPNGSVAVVASTYNYFSGFSWGGNRPVYTPNGYDYGWCTWWASTRRTQLGRPVPSNFGNAYKWYTNAQRAGLQVGDKPIAGAVFSQSRTGSLGHVGIVESVNEDGSFQASDMNYPIWGKATYRTVPVNALGDYKFIY